jgi:hypothetical protein
VACLAGASAAGCGAMWPRGARRHRQRRADRGYARRGSADIGQDIA